MKRTLIALAVMVVVIFAWGSSSIAMTESRAEMIGDSSVRCHYTQSVGGDFQTSVVIHGSEYGCPHAIHFYPESGSWE